MRATNVTRHRQRLVALAVFASVWSGAVSVHAQFESATEGLGALGDGPLTAVDAFALEVNPALLAALPAWHARYVHHQGNGALGRSGDAFMAGVPLPFSLAAGLGFEHVRPAAQASRGMFHWGLAAGSARTGAFGFGVRHLASRQDSALAGVTSLDLGVFAPLYGGLSFSLVARDLLAPLELGTGPLDIPASFRSGLRFEPAAISWLGASIEGAVDTDGTLGARMGARVGPEDSIAATVLATYDEVAGIRRWQMQVGAQAALGSVRATGGGLWSQLDEEGTPGWWLSASVAGKPRGLSGFRRGWVRFDVEALSGPRDFFQLYRRLERLIDDGRTKGVVLAFKGGGLRLSDAQELRQLLLEARQRDMKSVCVLREANRALTYGCAAADMRLIDPAGYVEARGFASESLHVGPLLSRLGVRADFLRIGSFKSAPEQWTRGSASAPSLAQRGRFVQQISRRIIGEFALGLDWSRERAADFWGQGLVTAARAESLGYAKIIPDSGAIDKLVGELNGGEAHFIGAPKTSEPFQRASERRVAVVVLDGVMVDGESMDVPLLGFSTSGADDIIKAIKRYASDPTIGAIVLRVDSPGGSALAADRIWRAVRAVEKPVIASVGQVAASGGYYVASAADVIVANPSAIVGSIGIFFGKVDLAGLLEKVGVGVSKVAAGEGGAADSLYEPFSPAERAQLTDALRAWYRLFLRRVAEGRGMQAQAVHALGQGRIFSADDPVAAKLTDHMGGLRVAVALARKRGDVRPEAPLVVAPARPEGLLERVLGTPKERKLAEASASLGANLGASHSARNSARHGGIAAQLARLPAVAQASATLRSLLLLSLFANGERGAALDPRYLPWSQATR